LIEAGARGVLVAVFTDAPLADEAHRLGIGADFEARLNRDAQGDCFALPLQHRARVLALSDGEFVGRKGLVKGSV
jgi:microcystin degradation protein MlrC